MVVNQFHAPCGSAGDGVFFPQQFSMIFFTEITIYFSFPFIILYSLWKMLNTPTGKQNYTNYQLSYNGNDNMWTQPLV